MSDQYSDCMQFARCSRCQERDTLRAEVAKWTELAGRAGRELFDSQQEVATLREERDKWKEMHRKLDEDLAQQIRADMDLEDRIETLKGEMGKAEDGRMSALRHCARLERAIVKAEALLRARDEEMAKVRALLNPACEDETLLGAIRNLQQAHLSEKGNAEEAEAENTRLREALVGWVAAEPANSIRWAEKHLGKPLSKTSLRRATPAPQAEAVPTEPDPHVTCPKCLAGNCQFHRKPSQLTQERQGESQ